MLINTEIRRNLDEAREALADPKPLHAVAGAGDLIVERVRTAALAQQRALQSVRLEPSAVRALVSSTIDNVRGAIIGFPERAQGAAVDGAVRANDTYDDLAKRGADLVRRIARQRASQELADQLDNTVRAAKATGTTARTAAGSTGSRVLAIATSARNAAAAAAAATTAAAAKTGTTRTTDTTGTTKASPSARSASASASSARPSAKKTSARPAATKSSAAAK